MPDSTNDPALPPESAALGDAEFARRVAKARHDLRNPLAHILGFSELLIEKAGQQGFSFLKSRLQLIERSANELVLAVNLELEPQRIRAEEADIQALYEKLQRLGRRILQTAQSLEEKSVVRDNQESKDELSRISGAANQLLNMSQSTLAFLLGTTVAALSKAASERESSSGNLADGIARQWTTGRILICLEDGTHREKLNQILRSQGHSVQLMKRKRELKDLEVVGSMELVAVDLGASASEVVLLMRQIQDNAIPNPPSILIVCTNEELDKAAGLLETGVMDCLTIPFLPSLIKARVEGCLARRRLGELRKSACE